MRLLLVEDDRMIADAVRTALRQDGWAVDWLADGAAADEALRGTHYDLVLLDLGLPKRDGLAVLRELRARRDAVPVIILTARDDIPTRIAGLDSGADDYLIKPFDLDELAARMRSVLRRGEGRQQPQLEHRGVSLDPASHEVRLNGQPVNLSAREFAVLEALIRRPGTVLSRAQIEERLYGWGQDIDSNAIEVYIHALRRKLGAEAIRTVRGVGYCLPND